MKKVIYIAGPFRGSNQWEQEQNIRRAESLALEVWKLGGVALCPHLNTRYFSGALPDEVWLEGDLELLRRCDAIYMMPGWEQSVGATAERAFAVANGIRILHGIFDDQVSWHAEQWIKQS